jgi:hypothetical protein
MENTYLDSGKALKLENTDFLAKHFYDEKIHFSYRWNQTIYPDRANILKKSIEIISSGEYSKHFFKEQLLYNSINTKSEFGEDEFNSDNFATEFWEDLYYLKWYEEKRDNIIEESKQMEQFMSQNNHFNDDILAKDYFDEIINDSQQELNDINTIIELSKEFRKLINEAFPNLELENEFARFLKEYNDFLEVKAERFQAQYEERKSLEEERIILKKEFARFLQETKDLQINEREQRISIKTSTIQQQSDIETLPPPPIAKLKPEQEQPTFENNFDNIQPNEVYRHFKAGLVDKKYLTEQELNDYLKTAFELKTIPETLFKIKDAPKKGTIEAVFYTYYKNVAGKNHGKQKQYAALLGDYFEGYKTDNVSSNFSKSVY